MSRLARLTFLFWIAGACSAQQVRQQALGFLFDSPAGVVRPVWGVPGAAHVGNPLELGAGIAGIAASPNQDFLVVLAGTSRTAEVWMHDTQTIQALPNVQAGATQVSLSPEGGSAAFFYPDLNRIQVVTGMPSAPVASFTADLSSLMNPLRAFTVSDDGALLLASESFVDGNAAPAVVAYGPEGVVSRIPLAGSASAIAFVSHTHDVLLSSDSEAVLVRDAAAQASRTLLAALANSAAGVISSSDGKRALFANSSTGLVSVFSLQSPGATPVTLDCQCAPTGIFRTAAPSIYRLTGDAGAPVSLLDVSSTQPRLLLIPPAVVTENTPGNQ